MNSNNENHPDGEEDVKVGVARTTSSDDDVNDDGDAYDPSTNATEVSHPSATSIAFNDELYANEKDIHRGLPNLDKGNTKDHCDELSSTHYDLEKGDNTKQDEAAEPSSTPAAQSNGKVPSVPLGGGRAFGRHRAMVPGVEYVHRRAPGIRPASYIVNIHVEARRRAQQQEQQSPAAETIVRSTPITAPCTPVESAPPLRPPKVQRSYFYVYASIVACLIIGTAVGVGVALGTRSNSDGNDNATRFSPFTKDCKALQSQPEPNFMSQCQCTGKISTLSSDIVDRYNSLTTALIPTLFPVFHESLESCSTRNQALVWLASGDGKASQPAMRQRYLLALLFIAWDGPSWTVASEWLTAKAECSWNGVACDTNNEIVKLDLSNKNLNGDLGSDFALLTSLVTLSLAHNKLQGTLPTEIVSLTNLRELSLNSSSLCGSIPSEIGKLLQLTSLVINNNYLVGPLPTELGALAGLIELQVDFNALNGTIPREYGQLSGLTSLTIGNNYLIGPLPTELGMLSELRELRVSSNRLNGTIPSELGLLKKLESIALVNTTLTGELPTQIGLWKNVQLIDISLNTLASTIPTEIGQLSNLTSLSLMKSGIHGTIPEELFRIKGLQSIIATTNDLRGTISSLVGQLTSLTSLYLDENFLTGTIPNEIGNCTSLAQLYVDGNMLNGTIPVEIGSLHLVTLNLIGNAFTGSVPTEVCAVLTPLYCYQGYRSSLTCTCCNCPGGAFN